MDLDALGRTWQRLGASDPRWAILSDPDRKDGGGDDASFWQSGVGFVAMVAEHLAGLGVVPARRRALDFGCGHGRLTQGLAQHFDEVVGVDIAESMLAGARAANRHGDRVRYEHNARADLAAFGDASFDFVLSVIVLQHMRTDYAKGYLREFLRILRPGGVAFFQLPIEQLAVPGVARAATAGTAAERPLPSSIRASTSIVPGRVVVAAGEWAWLRVHVVNEGPVSWCARGDAAVEIGTRLQRVDATAVAAAQWTPLPHDVDPGRAADVLVPVQASAPPDSYLLAALPVAARTWCSHGANAGAAIPLLVTPDRGGSRERPPLPIHLAGGAQRTDASGIEVHGTALADVEAAVAAGGGAIVDVSLDAWAGPQWLSAHFTVRKH